ncbi:MAG TPA: hypothetical protein VG826_10900 [Pirellulales bacterium]|nr:hypothetical protein [Pirellulales bacterium]
MTDIDSSAPLETLDLMILVRLLEPATPTKARQDVGKIAAAGIAQGEWNSMFEAHWKRLIDRGLIGRSPGKRSGQSLTPTDAGRRHALNFLQVSKLPDKVKWATLQADYLLPLAMNCQPGSAKAQQLKSAPQFKLAVISQARRLSPRNGATAKTVLATLAWKLIGVESEADFTAENVIQQIGLGQRPARKVTATQLAAALAARALGANKTTLTELRSAALRQWLLASVPAPGASTDDLGTFASQVIDAARRCQAAARFGDNKVFISHVWRQMNGPLGAAPELGTFKQRLLEANRDGLLQLSRADLVEAMNPVDVQESSTVYDNATFHFVRI